MLPCRILHTFFEMVFIISSIVFIVFLTLRFSQVAFSILLVPILLYVGIKTIKVFIPSINNVLSHIISPVNQLLFNEIGMLTQKIFKQFSKQKLLFYLIFT